LSYLSLEEEEKEEEEKEEKEEVYTKRREEEKGYKADERKSEAGREGGKDERLR